MSSLDFIPLSLPYLVGNEWTYIKNCLDTGWVSSAGSYVTQFENNIANYTQSKHATAMVNGTAALHISYILAGIGTNDEVIAPTITFIAPINALSYQGANPIFMDCDAYLNLDPVKLESFLKNECTLKNGITTNKKTGRPVKAIVVVHIFGHPANLNPIVKLAKDYNLTLIEDATESLGSVYLSWQGSGLRHCGTIGQFGCLSFNGNKIITTGGGGMVLTADGDLAKKASYLSTQAKKDPIYFQHEEVGYNYRLTNIQSAMGVAQLELLDQIIERKRSNFLKYKERLKSCPHVKLIEEPEGTLSNYWHYALVTDCEGPSTERDKLLASLKKNQIEARPLWHPNHLQKHLREKQSYCINQATWYGDRVINIPCSAALTENQIERVSQTIIKHYQ